MNLQRTIEKYNARVKSPLTGIRAFCVQCMGGQVREIATCPSVKCPLYDFRTGHNTRHGLHLKKSKIVDSSSRILEISHVSDIPDSDQRAA